MNHWLVSMQAIGSLRECPESRGLVLKGIIYALLKAVMKYTIVGFHSCSNRCPNAYMQIFQL